MAKTSANNPSVLLAVPLTAVVCWFLFGPGNSSTRERAPERTEWRSSPSFLEEPNQSLSLAPEDELSGEAWTTDPHEMVEVSRSSYPAPVVVEKPLVDEVSGHLECPRKHCSGTMFLRMGSNGKFYDCASTGCRMTIDHPFRCYKCSSSMVLRDGKYGLFWGCSGFPLCHHTNDHK